jgi:glycosyltransferase involved in cell wall biosynthesis
MRVAVAKPDWGILGGFERVVQRVVRALRAAGHSVDVLTLPVSWQRRSINGVDIPVHVWEQAPEFFRYAALTERFAALDVADYDVVLTTQPGSHAVPHPRKLALFYHHLRVAYDLEELFAASGFPGAELAHDAAAAVRRLDAPHMASVACFLTPSATVRSRLRRFNHVDDDILLPYQAGPMHRMAPPDGSARLVLCVSRHEFSKRTELFVDAAFDGFDGRGAVLVGGGGQLGWVRWWAARRARGEEPPPSGVWPPPDAPSFVEESPVNIAGWVDDRRLAELSRQAACMVAPSYDEDYGLTALEAQAAGLPVVVCSDGGGLAELVIDGVTGYVVPPEGAAIAAAVRRLCADPHHWSKMSRAAREHAATFGWQQADKQLLCGLERVAA